jgi:hypothetical protein
MTKKETSRHVAPGPRPRRGPRANSPTSVPTELASVAPRAGDRTAGVTPILSVGANEPAEHLFRRLLGVYLGGAPEFAVYESPAISAATRDVVRTFCRRTRQPEIVSEEPNSILLHDLSFESPISLDQRVQRMGRLVLAIHREAVEGWGHLPFGDDGYWARRDDEVDREAWYIQRIATLRLTGPDQPAELLGAWTIARSLERIADHASVLGVTGPRLVALPQGQGPMTPLRQFHAQAMEHLEGALAATDGDRANELLDTGTALGASGEAIADRLLPGVGGGVMPPATAAAVARILESIGRTIAYAQDIVQVALDRSIPARPFDPRPVGVPLAATTRRERFVSAAAR